MKTEFINKENNRFNECVLGVSVKLCQQGCQLQWTYPIGYSSVKIFEIPLYESFDENKAINGEYPEHILSIPQQQFNSDRLVNFAIFPINEDNKLIRQDISTWCFTAAVSYGIAVKEEMIKKQGTGLFGKLRSKSEKKTSLFLKIKSPINLPGRCIMYSLKSAEGVFCLPFGLEADKTYTIPINEAIELFTEEKFIVFQKNLQ